MSMIELKLRAETEHLDGYCYHATVESGVEDLCRVNIACHNVDNDDTLSSQGMDLTAAECRAFAQMLLAAAAILDADSGIT